MTEIQEIEKEGMMVNFTVDKKFWKNPIEINVDELEEEEE